MDSGPSSDRRAIEAALKETPDLALLGLMPNSTNHTFLAYLPRPDPQTRLLGVYKPARGERPLWDFPDFSLYRREVAAYVVAQRLGWPLVPPTVVRTDAPYGVGSLQLYVAAEIAEPPWRQGAGPEAWIEIAVFDFLVNNADRKLGHCLVDGFGRLWAIDHGLTFHPEFKLRTVIWEFAGRRLPSRLRAGVEGLLAQLRDPAARPELEALLSAEELAALAARVEAALDSGFRLPHPPAARPAIPWPPL